MSKTILMIAFEFPPSNGASVPRIESFYRYLKKWGWKVIVLTATPGAYSNINSDYEDAPDDLIHRARALDVQRQLSFKGKYFEVMATPDRWGLTWIPTALIKGRKLVKKYQPDIIWSSSPIPSTHYIANKLAQFNKTPWIADYRDPFHYMNGTAGNWLDYFHKKIDQTTLKNATHVTFATTAVKKLYQDKYKAKIDSKNSVIENGFDEANFEKIIHQKIDESIFSQEKFSLYYCGVLYPNGRDPVAIFEAISTLKNQGVIAQNNFELIFQGAGNGGNYEECINKLGVDKLVRFISPVPFLVALKNMTQASALLLIQDSRFNKQIPGKVYEYLRTEKPLLVKADLAGETAKLVNKFSGVGLGNKGEELADKLNSMIQQEPYTYIRNLEQYTREKKSRELECIMKRLLD